MTHIVRDIEIAGVRINCHLRRPVHLRLRAFDGAYRRHVTIRAERVNRDRWVFESSGARRPVVADVSPVRNVEQPVLRIERHAVHVGQSRAFPLQASQGLVVSGCALAVHGNFRRILHADEKLVLFFVGRESEATMRSLENARGFHISFGIARKHDDLIAGVGLDRIDIAVLRIDVEAVVELDVGFRPGDDPFGFGGRSVRRSIVRAIEHTEAPVVVVHQDDFIEPRVDRDGTVDRILVANRADRRPGDDRSIGRCLPSRMNRRLTERREQVGVFGRCLFSRRTPVRIQLQILNRNQLRMARALTQCRPFDKRQTDHNKDKRRCNCKKFSFVHDCQRMY